MSTSAATTSASTPATSPEVRRRVLVVDDEPEMANVIEQALTRRGYHAVQCNSADAAWETLEREDFDVVVTDLNMRGMSGVDLTDRVAKNRVDLPVIVITAFGSLETAIATMRGFTISACSASFSTLRFAVSASTVNAPGWRSSRSIVLQPTEPVDPSTLTLRGARSAIARGAVIAID